MKLFKNKITIASLLAICVMASYVFPLVKVEASEEEYGIMLISANPFSAEIGETIVETALSLEEAHPYRGSGTTEEAETAQTLASMLEEYGFGTFYDSYINEFIYTPLIDSSGTTTVTDQMKTSQNVIGYVDNGSEYTIIIGAHYDNYVYETGSTGTGFYDNLLGVATALEIAYQLSLEDGLGYNIMVAFWGAEEDGMHGSEYFVSSQTKEYLSKVALYINLDTIGVGDNLYIYTNEIADLHEYTFLEEAENLGYDLQGAPEDKQYTLAMLEERPFMHIGIQSDNFYFTTSGVMCANFISYVWSDEGLFETALDSNVQYTANDNSEYIFSVHTKEKIENSMTEVAEIILATLTREDILSVLQESAEESSMIEILYDDSFAVIATTILLAVFAGFVFIKIRKLDKEVKLPEGVERSTPGKVETVQVFGETVTLEDGVVRKEYDGGIHDRSQLDNTPKNPFDF